MSKDSRIKYDKFDRRVRRYSLQPALPRTERRSNVTKALEIAGSELRVHFASPRNNVSVKFEL